MFISKLEWDDYRVEHVALPDLDPDEVWEVCEDPLHRAIRQGRDRCLVHGQTAAGRYVLVVLEHVEGTVYRPITARGMTDRERRNFRGLRG